MSITLGIFIQFLLGTFINWRNVALINILFPVIAFTCLFFIPESPHWLISKNRLKQAKQSLQWLRGWCSEEEIIDEYNEIYENVHKIQPGLKTEVHERKFDHQDYIKRTFVIPAILVALTFFLGHFSGMTTLQTYAVNIFGDLKVPINKYYATLMLGIVELAGTLLCVFLVHWTGKRVITFASLIGTATCFIISGCYAFVLEDLEDAGGKNPYSWIPLTFLLFSAFLSHMGIKLLPWILIGEVFPIETRGNGSGLSSGLGYIFGFLANKTFFATIDWLSLPGIFWMYGVIAFIGAGILYWFLPETEGKPLSEIELHFRGEKKLNNSVRRRRRKDVESVAMEKVGVDGIPEKEILDAEVTRF